MSSFLLSISSAKCEGKTCPSGGFLNENCICWCRTSDPVDGPVRECGSSEISTGAGTSIGSGGGTSTGGAISSSGGETNRGK